VLSLTGKAQSLNGLFAENLALFADDVIRIRDAKELSKPVVKIDNTPVRVQKHDSIRDTLQNKVKLRSHVGNIGHIAGNTHGSHNSAIGIEQGGLARLELAHALRSLDHFVKHPDLARVHNDLIRLKTDKFALRIFLRLNIPYKVMPAPFNNLAALAHKAAKGFVHLYVCALGILEPHKVCGQVNDGVKV